jgi:hypothetical protein
MQFMLQDFQILLTFDNTLPNDSIFKSLGLELILFVNLGGFPVLLPLSSLGCF